MSSSELSRFFQLQESVALWLFSFYPQLWSLYVFFCVFFAFGLETFRSLYFRRSSILSFLCKHLPLHLNTSISFFWLSVQSSHLSIYFCGVSIRTLFFVSCPAVVSSRPVRCISFPLHYNFLFRFILSCLFSCIYSARSRPLVLGCFSFCVQLWPLYLTCCSV